MPSLINDASVTLLPSWIDVPDTALSLGTTSVSGYTVD